MTFKAGPFGNVNLPPDLLQGNLGHWLGISALEKGLLNNDSEQKLIPGSSGQHSGLPARGF